MSGCSETQPHEHFAKRVRERVGDVDPAWVWQRLIVSIRYDDGWARFKARQHFRGCERKIYYFEHQGRRHFAVVDLDLPKIIPITILPRESMIKTKLSKRYKHLQNGNHSHNRKKMRKQKDRRR
jgi:hypothetical protein